MSARCESSVNATIPRNLGTALKKDSSELYETSLWKPLERVRCAVSIWLSPWGYRRPAIARKRSLNWRVSRAGGAQRNRAEGQQGTQDRQNGAQQKPSKRANCSAVFRHACAQKGAAIAHKPRIGCVQ